MQSSGDYSQSSQPVKKIVMNNKTAILSRKESLFSQVSNISKGPMSLKAWQGMKVESCTEITKCSRQNVGKKLESLLRRCNFEGKMDGDPASKVSLVSCQKGAADISVVSDTANLDTTNYRVHSDGKIEKSQKSFQTDEPAEVSN